MELKIERTELEEALKVLSRLCAPENVTFEATKKRTYLYAAGELNKGRIRLTAKASEEASFGIPFEQLRTAISGRAALELTFKNNTLNIKSGSYKVALPAIDADQQDAEAQETKATAISISQELGAWLKSAVSDVALKPNALLSNYMPLGVSATKKGVSVICYDSTHMAFTSTKEYADSFEFMLPHSTVAALLDVFSKDAFEITIQDSVVRCKNKAIDVELAVPEKNETLPEVSDAVAKAREANKADGSAFGISKSSLLSFLDNCKSVALRERGEVSVSHTKKGTKLAVTNVSGTVQEVLQGKGKPIDFKVDYEYFEEFARRAGEEIEIKVVEGAFMAGKSSRASFIIALNQ